MPLHPILADPGETMLRQSLLSLAPRDVTVQDQLDRAGWLQAAGHAQSAHLLFGVAALRLGVADETLRWLAAYAERIGYRLRRPTAPAAAPPAEPAFAVDLAVAELTRILPLLPASSAFVVSPASSFEASVTPVMQDDGAVDDRLDAFFTRVGPALATLLGMVGEADDEHTIAGLAALVADAETGLGPFDISRHAGATVDRLARIAAFNQLEHFLHFDGSIADAPFGSPELLNTAACFAPTALGAYFANVKRLVRNPDDLFALIRLASREATADVNVGGACVLLSTHFAPAAARDLAGALLQHELLDALRGMIARVDDRAKLSLDREFLWHVRDLSLLHDRVEIARDCQAVLARRAMTNSIEWIILADICAVAGDMTGVEASLSRAFAISSGDHGAGPRLDALRDGTVAHYARTEGFFGAPERAHLRFRRRKLSG